MVLVFTDYTCPHCVALHGEVLEGLRKAHIENGKAVLEIRHPPWPDDKSLGLVRAAPATERVARKEPAKDGVEWRVWEIQMNLFEFAGVLPAGKKGINGALA